MGSLDFSIPKNLVLDIVNSVKIKNFIETGTHMGGTCFWAANYFENVYTIEIDELISKTTASRLDCPKNIIFVQGDSRYELPKIVNKIKDRSFYWLDGHWCSNAGGYENECPILDEINAIPSFGNDVIFIDDARLFMGPLPSPHKSEQWPLFDEIYDLLRVKFPKHRIIVNYDVIMCLPLDVFQITYSHLKNLNLTPDFEENQSDLNSIKGISFEKIAKQIFNKIKYILKKLFPFLRNKNEVITTPAINIEENKLNTEIEKYKWIKELNLKSIVDIGANTGQFAARMRELFSDAKIYSFEPIEEVYKTLSLNFKDDTNFLSFNVGIGDKKESKVFYLNEYSDSSSFLRMKRLHKENFPYTENESEINVQIDLLDELTKNIKIEKPFLVKIDVQGYEDKVINGGIQTIRDADYIIVEVSFHELYDNLPKFDLIYSLLRGLGFEYMGNVEQLYSTIDNKILQADAFFKKISG